MRAVAVILCFVIATGGLFLASRAFRDATTVEVRPDEPSDLPEPAREGPHPKAVLVGGGEYDFGMMEQGQESSHIFTIRNDGEAPLRLAANYKGANTCECTVGELARNEVAPGESVEVKVSWGVKKPVINFAHSARIRTNDPEHTTIPLVIKGVIGRRAVVLPSTSWSIGQLDSGATLDVDITLHSEIADAFQLQKIENPSGLITTTSRPLKDEELQDLSTANQQGGDDTGQHDKASQLLKAGNNRPTPKSGYKITATIEASKLKSGPFLETLIFHTDLTDNHTISFDLRGSRAGFIEFSEANGVVWNSDRLLLRLGRFQARKGKTIRIPMLVKDVTGEGSLTVQEIRPKFLSVSFEQDTEFPGQTTRRYFMTLTVPKDAPPVALVNRNQGQVTLALDGANKRTMRFFVGFVSN